MQVGEVLANEEIVERATAKLLGEFYVGQRVAWEFGAPGKRAGVITELLTGIEGRSARVLFDGDSYPRKQQSCFFLWALTPL